MSEIISLGTGKMSTFGGPADEGVGPHEGLALIGPTDLALWWFSCLFLSQQPVGTTGLARRLNPRAYYLAMRWNYGSFPKDLLRYTVVKLTNPATGLHVIARPVDYGPGDGAVIDGQPARHRPHCGPLPRCRDGTGVADG